MLNSYLPINALLGRTISIYIYRQVESSKSMHKRGAGYFSIYIYTQIESHNREPSKHSNQFSIYIYTQIESRRSRALVSGYVFSIYIYTQIESAKLREILRFQHMWYIHICNCVSVINLRAILAMISYADFECESIKKYVYLRLTLGQRWACSPYFI